jgi:hypothetical protein
LTRSVNFQPSGRHSSAREASKVFAKLQIASRADLARIDLGEHTSA